MPIYLHILRVGSSPPHKVLHASEHKETFQCGTRFASNVMRGTERSSAEQARLAAKEYIGRWVLDLASDSPGTEALF